MTLEVTIAIPTYNRGAILVETLQRLMVLAQPAQTILVADQTPEHPPAVQRRLEAWSGSGAIQWLRLPQPSIPAAMNRALLAATTPLVLFLDDDIVPSPDLVAAHMAAHHDPSIWAVVGQVLQPWDQAPAADPKIDDDLEFRFNSDARRPVTNAMAGNLSVKRDRALAAGGFDENFIGAAYRFESDFALRLCAAGGRILYEPGAGIRHLKLDAGGIRSLGDHRSSTSPMHSAGDYYFALFHRPPFAAYAARRLARNVLTRYHALHPWTIPAKVIGEVRGISVALRLKRKGRKLVGARA